jgi:dihydroflavonol-4-reductase
MRILVTGPTGFLGRHVVSELRTRGHEVVALCRRPSDAGLDGVTLARGDVLEPDSVRAAAAGCEALVHCAGKVSRLREDAAELYRVNVEGTKLALAAARDAGVRRVVIASTSGTVAVTAKSEVRSETAPPPMEVIASWPYYRAKLFAEQHALAQSRPGFEVVSVNPSLLLGPGDVHGSSTEDVVRFLERKVPFVPAGGMSFVDARDAAAAMALALDKGRAGERYLVGAVNLTLAAFFDRLERLTGVRGPRIPTPRSVGLARLGSALLERASKHIPQVPPLDEVTAEMSQRFFYVDASKAERELGWTHRDPGETLRDTVDDLRARGVVWPD